jgi:site-specific recombinase XerD
MSERTQEMYVRAVRQLAQHYHKSPDLITEEELRQYFLFIKNVKHYSRSASTIAMCGIKFFFEQTLHREWPTLSFVRAAPEKKLPVILSPDEVRRILGAIRLLRYRVCLSTIYSCGLRLQEGTHLQVPDIDSARLVIHLRHRKGNKDRYLPLPQPTLTLLRQYWVTHRHGSPDLSFGGSSASRLVAGHRTAAQEQRAGRFPRRTNTKRHPPAELRSTRCAILGRPICWRRESTCD